MQILWYSALIIPLLAYAPLSVYLLSKYNKPNLYTIKIIDMYADFTSSLAIGISFLITMSWFLNELLQTMFEINKIDEELKNSVGAEGLAEDTWWDYLFWISLFMLFMVWSSMLFLVVSVPVFIGHRYCDVLCEREQMAELQKIEVGNSKENMELGEILEKV